jgi:hypothetical protein
VFAASRPSVVLSDAAHDAVLADLATGPAAEVVALWREVAGEGTTESQLWAARVVIERGDRPVASAARAVAPAAPIVAAALAVDPATDRPLAVWRTLDQHSRIEYAVGTGARGYRPHAAGVAAPEHGGGTHWVRIAVIALAVAIVALAVALAALRRSRSARASG